MNVKNTWRGLRDLAAKLTRAPKRTDDDALRAAPFTILAITVHADNAQVVEGQSKETVYDNPLIYRVARDAAHDNRVQCVGRTLETTGSGRRCGFCSGSDPASRSGHQRSSEHYFRYDDRRGSHGL